MEAALKQQAALRSLELAARASAANFGSMLTPQFHTFILLPLRQVTMLRMTGLSQNMVLFHLYERLVHGLVHIVHSILHLQHHEA
jgi:hypothetical protein